MPLAVPLSGGTWWRSTDLEEAQQLSPKEDLAGRTEALERAFGAEVTSSMSLNVRATGLAGGSALAILLLAQFASTWLDIVYSALSSHASYEKAGKRQVVGEKGTATDVTQAGRRWATWDQLGGLRRVRDEPWYGFGGAWGRAKDPDGTTGPLGPSQWKLPADPDPGDLRSGH
jgi:hypothetical protein